MAAQNSTNPTEEITLEEAAEAFPRKKRHGKYHLVHVRTIQRWIEKGCRGVKLAGRRSGNVWYTTLAAIEAFRSDGTAKRVGVGRVEVQSASQKKRQDRQTQANLQAKGLRTDVQDKEAARRALEKAQVHAMPFPS